MLLKSQKLQFLTSSVCVNGMSLLKISSKNSLNYLSQVASNEALKSCNSLISRL